MPENDVIRQGALDRLREWGGEKLLLQMIRLFLENAEKRLTQIEAGFAGNDIEGVERGAHSLKSSAGNVGAVTVSRLAQQMEDHATAGKMESARALHSDLVSGFEEASAHLRRIQEEAGA